MRNILALLIALPLVVHARTAAACDDSDDEDVDDVDDVTVHVADANARSEVDPEDADEEVAEVETPDIPAEIESRIDELQNRLDELDDRVNELGDSPAPQIDVDVDVDVDVEN